MVNKNSLPIYLYQASKIRKVQINIKFYKVYINQLKNLKKNNFILGYKIVNNRVIILLNLNR